MAGLRHLTTYNDPEEAYVVIGALKAAGFAAQFDSGNLLALEPHLRVAVGYYRVYVPATQLQPAKAFLAEFTDHSPSDPIGANQPCVECGGVDFRREKSWLWAICGLGFGAPFAADTGNSLCRNCGAAIKGRNKHRLGTIFVLILIVTTLGVALLQISQLSRFYQ